MPTPTSLSPFRQTATQRIAPAERLQSFAIPAPKLETTAHWLKTGAPDPLTSSPRSFSSTCAGRFLVGRLKLAGKALGGNARE
jgi:hypothetical protein